MLRLRKLLRIATPRWASGKFGLVSFADCSFEGQSFELEWLGLKLLVAIGRMPKQRPSPPRNSG